MTDTSASSPPDDPHIVTPPASDDTLASPGGGQVSYSKEGEPMRVSHESAGTGEDAEGTAEQEPQRIEKDLEQYIDVKPETIEIHPELRKAGLQAIDTTSPDWKQRVHLPISDEKVLIGLKEPPSSGLRWIAEIAVFMLKRAHLQIKRIHGHVVRVIRRT